MKRVPAGTVGIVEVPQPRQLLECLLHGGAAKRIGVESLTESRTMAGKVDDQC